MKIINKTKDTVLSDTCEVADRFFSRFKGLLGRKNFPVGEALLLKPCNSIHMFFMRFPIDAVFLGKDSEVVHLMKEIKPWTVSPVIKKARSVLELPAGTIDATETTVGDLLCPLFPEGGDRFSEPS